MVPLSPSLKHQHSVDTSRVITMTSLADLPFDILARIYYKGLELGRKELFLWNDDLTSCEIDNEVYNCTLRQFFKALDLQVDEAQYVTLEYFYRTGWINYEWTLSSHLF